MKFNDALSNIKKFILTVGVFSLLGPVIGGIPPIAQLLSIPDETATGFGNYLVKALVGILSSYVFGWIPALIAGVLNGILILTIDSRMQPPLKNFFSASFFGIITGAACGWLATFLWVSAQALKLVHYDPRLSLISTFAGSVCGLISLLVYRERIHGVPNHATLKAMKDAA